MAAGKPGEAEARLRRFDGQYRWFLFRANPMRDESGKIVKWYGTNTDINDRKRAEAEVKESYLRLAEAQRLSKTGVYHRFGGRRPQLVRGDLSAFRVRSLDQGHGADDSEYCSPGGPALV